MILKNDKHNNHDVQCATVSNIRLKWYVTTFIQGFLPVSFYGWWLIVDGFELHLYVGRPG